MSGEMEIKFTTERTYISVVSEGKLISNSNRQIVEIVNYVILCSLISGFGIVSNIINLVVFLKQGMNSTINISFFALAISDMTSLIFQLWFNVCVNPFFQRADILIVPSEIAYISGGVPRVFSAMITFLVTVYITAERCLCVAFPLHVKKIITPRRTTIIIFLLYSMTISFSIPVYCANTIQWKFYPEQNKTLLGHVPTRNRDKVERTVFVIQSILGIISFIAVVTFTCILICKLQQKNNWRHTASVNTKQSESMSNRDRKTINLVVVIAGVLIISNTPGVLLCMVTFIEPELSFAGQYSNLYFVVWSFAFVFEAINSSVNIFLYFKMSSKYRDTFLEIFSSCAGVFLEKPVH